MDISRHLRISMAEGPTLSLSDFELVHVLAIMR